MIGRWQRILIWAPRLLCLALAAFLAVLAADVFTEGRPFGATIVTLAIHLVPAILVLVLVGIAWHHEWLGGAVAMVLALFYLGTKGRTLPWTDSALIAGPLVIIACLYFANATLHRHRPASADGPAA
jgi:hypothetical protein